MAARLSAEGKVARDNRVVADRAHGLRGSTVASATKRDKALWVYLPEWLIDAIEATCPLEDRTLTGASSRASRGRLRTRR